MPDTSEKGFNFAGNNVRVPVMCEVCSGVTSVWSRNVSWLCPYCGHAMSDVDKHIVSKDVYNQRKKIGDMLSVKSLQHELWGLPEEEAAYRSSEIENALRRGKNITVF